MQLTILNLIIILNHPNNYIGALGLAYILVFAILEKSTTTLLNFQ